MDALELQQVGHGQLNVSVAAVESMAGRHTAERLHINSQDACYA
jgi:hypothetical protein